MTDPHHSRGPRVSGKIFISGGEISGDRQAAYLARALRTENQDVYLYGCGGDQMRKAGVDVRFETARLGYIGLQEATRFLGPIRAARRGICELLKKDPPDLVVLVDGEHFNPSLASFLHRERIPFIYYFVPQVWFWGRWRTRGIARTAQLVIPAFEAELEIFRREGARVQWLGHPLLDIVRPDSNPEARLAEFGLNPTRPMIALLPGSRMQEVENFGPVLLGAARQLRQSRPELQFVLPLAAPHLRAPLEKQITQADLNGNVTLIDRHVYTCLSRCEVALLSSGTATLETALLGVPMVVFYRLKPLTFFIARRMVASRFIAMPNILLKEAVVPELIQHDFTIERLVAEASRLLSNADYARNMRRQLARIPALLGRPGVQERAARTVLREAGLSHAPVAVEPLALPQLA